MKPINTQKEYQDYVNQKSPNSPIIKNCFNAFWVGGLICTIGQFIMEICKYRGLDNEISATITSIILIFLSAFLTALNLFNRIGKFAGARFSCSNYWFCKFNCFTCYGIQIRRICYGCWSKNVYSSRSCTCLWNFYIYSCWNSLFNF